MTDFKNDEGREYQAAREMLLVIKMELQSAGLLTENMAKAIDLGKDALVKQNVMANAIRTCCDAAVESFEREDYFAFNFFRAKKHAYVEALVNEAPQLEKRLYVDSLYEHWVKEKEEKSNNGKHET